MRAVAGICRIGMIPGRLQRYTKMKMDNRNGVHPSPSRPIVCMTICSSMNSTPDSATLRTPVGATSGSRIEATR